MIWLLVGIWVQYLLIIALCCIVIWYRSKLEYTRKDYNDCIEENRKLRDNLNWYKKECDRKLPKRDSKGRFCKREVK